MRECAYAVVSKNTVDRLSLHDCECSALYSTSGKLTLEMDWMDVLPEHPNNPWPEARQSGPGRIELLEPVLVRGELYPSFADKHPEALKEISAVRFRRLILLSFAERAAECGYDSEIFAVFTGDAAYDSLRLEVRYRASSVMWDSLGKTSWFVKQSQKQNPECRRNDDLYERD